MIQVYLMVLVALTCTPVWAEEERWQTFQDGYAIDKDTIRMDGSSISFWLRAKALKNIGGVLFMESKLINGTRESRSRHETEWTPWEPVQPDTMIERSIEIARLLYYLDPKRLNDPSSKWVEIDGSKIEIIKESAFFDSQGVLLFFARNMMEPNSKPGFICLRVGSSGLESSNKLVSDKWEAAGKNSRLVPVYKYLSETAEKW